MPEAQELKPYQVALEHGFVVQTPNFLEKVLPPTEPGFPRAVITLESKSKGWHLLRAKSVTDGSSVFFMQMPLHLDSKGVLKNFDTEEEGEAMGIFRPVQDWRGDPVPYYAVSYTSLKEDPDQARMESISVISEDMTMKYLDDGLVRLIPELPKEADLRKTLMMYLEGQYEKDGEMVPINADSLPIMPVLA